MSLNYKVVASDVIDVKQLNKHCLINGWDKAKFIQLKQENFELESDVDVNKAKLALQLLNCLASPDPQLRDGIAYQGLSHWLINNSFDSKIYLAMFNTLTGVLSSKVNDPSGGYLPFVVLTLAEVARVDRKLLI